MKFPFSKKSQSTSEYTLLILIAIGVILIAKPLATRAINAQMKSWQDAVHDSMHEPLIEGKSPPPGGGCNHNGHCDSGETFSNCCNDCPKPPATNTCPDTFCCDVAHGGTETLTSCPQDCAVCGDNICSPTETPDTCCFDCPETGFCPDGWCCVLDNTVSPAITHRVHINDPSDPRQAVGRDAACWQDCPQIPFCPNTRCDPGESTVNCCADCYDHTRCGNHVCDPCEEATSGCASCQCPGDCGCNVCLGGSVNCALFRTNPSLCNEIVGCTFFPNCSGGACLNLCLRDDQSGGNVPCANQTQSVCQQLGSMCGGWRVCRRCTGQIDCSRWSGNHTWGICHSHRCDCDDPETCDCSCTRSGGCLCDDVDITDPAICQDYGCTWH